MSKYCHVTLSSQEKYLVATNIELEIQRIEKDQHYWRSDGAATNPEVSEAVARSLEPRKNELKLLQRKFL